jgi:pantoate--beta-alanine ligase
MGALHAGHVSLMAKARGECQVVVTSLFVNPLQFGPSEDFARYPRNEQRDAEMAEAAGVDVLFAPSVEQIYPRPSTKVCVPEVGDLWEGAARPGHFDGVATVVCKLFNMVGPNTAYFGLKDLQQCAVVRRMVEDLNMDVSLRFCETLREQDGLAMSSRNVYLSPEERAVAPALYGELMRSRQVILRGERSVASTLEDARRSLDLAGFSVDYYALVDVNSMQPITEFRSGSALITAAKIGTTRLIDNVQLPE